MKRNGFDASTSGGKKAIAIALVLAMVLASISVIGALAAPSSKSGSARAFGSQLRELNADAAWFNSARLNAANFVNTSDPVRAQQYLSQYAFALGQAESIVKTGGTSTTNKNSSNSSSSTASSNTQFGSAQGNLASWLHTMRGLREKLVSIGFSNSVSNTSNVAGAGVPVTGGTTSNNGTSSSNSATATPGTSSSSSSSSSATATTTPTATPGTSSSSSSSSSSAVTPTATPGTSSSSSSGTSSSSSSSNGTIPNTGTNNNNFNLNRSALAKIWGAQFRELEADQVWLNNFKSNPANLVNSSDLGKTQQWLSQYMFALSQADTIVRSDGTSVTNNNNSNSSSTASSNTQFGSARGNLAQWLHMMHDLQVKLASGVNGTSSTP